MTHGGVAVRAEELTIGRRTVPARDITDLTWWTVRRFSRGATTDLRHRFLLRSVAGQVRFDIDVLAGAADERSTSARLAAEVIAWLQQEVEPGVRRRTLTRIGAGEVVRIGHCVVHRDGFGHASAFHHDRLHDWTEFRAVHVLDDSIEVLLATDDPERGRYGFGIRRASMNAVLLPELMLELARRGRG